MRKKIVAGNWKMNGSRESIHHLMDSLVKNVPQTFVEVAVFPSFVYLPLVHELCSNSEIKLGAQNLSKHDNGAYTGEISGAMLLDNHCEYVLVGHSERRAYYGETNAVVAEKFKQALSIGLTPILCIGETLQERQADKTWQVVQAQLEAVLQEVPFKEWKNTVIAYEPVWAIGTGLTATPEQAQEVHAQIRQFLKKSDLNQANLTSLLYGGSLKADNAASLFTMPDIDGGLVGGASLDANGFIKIIECLGEVECKTY
jgi:triosephosphate isomerase